MGKEREKMEEFGELCEIQSKKNRGGGTKCPKAKEQAPGREEDTGTFHFIISFLLKILFLKTHLTSSAVSLKKKKNPETMRDKW